jgi:hypothetical protein
LIFPEVAHWRIKRLNGASRSVANCSGRIFVNLGSYRITTGLRDRVTNHAQRMASETATHLIESVRGLDAPVFWLSVRMQTPTLANQRAVLSDVGVKILKKFPRCTILFDGFSPPHDWRESAKNDVQFYRTATQLSKDEIDAIVDDIVARQTPSESQQMANLAGLGILDCIALAKLATSYFCHIGTVQHKIGWTANIPGMIHANRSAIIYRSPIWYAPERLENAVVPVAIDDHLVSHLNDRKYYEILDNRAVAETVCTFFGSCVSPSVSSTRAVT